MAIQQTDGDTVQLGLAGIVHPVLAFQTIAYTAVEIPDLLIVEGIFQRQHGDQMLHFLESLERRSTDTLCG